MGKTFLKQTIKSLVRQTLLSDPSITSEAEVDRYNYATKLGKLEHIDYAIPLFGYAREAGKDPLEIYARLKDAVMAAFPCEVEFVNGYLNIMFTGDFLGSVLRSHAEPDVTEPPEETLAIVLVRTSPDTQAATASKVLQECLAAAGIASELLHPLPGEPSAAGQYRVESDDSMRASLSSLPGVVQEPDSGVVYVHGGNDSHALRSVKGGWYAPAFIMAAVKDNGDAGKKAFLVGTSGVNKLLRDVFPAASTLDVDQQAKHLTDAFHRSIPKVVSDAKAGYRAQTIKNLGTKQRRELLYILDFEYEIAEAARLGDLKRMIGEATTLFGQYPLPDIA